LKIVVADCSWGSIDVERRYLPPDSCVIGFQCKTAQEVVTACRDADAIMAEYAPLTSSVLENLSRCRIIANTAIGVDNIDIAAATRLGIAVTNVPGYCAHEVADHTMALLLALNRNIVEFERSIRKQIWDINSGAGMKRLAGQTMGLIGFGKIARMVAARAKSFGLKVIAYSPSGQVCTAADDVQLLDLDTVLSQSDILSVHLPLTEDTQGFFDWNKFLQMKKRPIFINTARGKVVNEPDLVAALQEGLISSAALDVLTEEPPDFTSEIFKFKNVIITPHVGFYSETSLEEVRRRSALNVTNFLQGNYSESNILNITGLKCSGDDMAGGF